MFWAAWYPLPQQVLAERTHGEWCCEGGVEQAQQGAIEGALVAQLELVAWLLKGDVAAGLWAGRRASNLGTGRSRVGKPSQLTGRALSSRSLSPEVRGNTVTRCNPPLRWATAMKLDGAARQTESVRSLGSCRTAALSRAILTPW